MWPQDRNLSFKSNFGIFPGYLSDIISASWFYQSPPCHQQGAMLRNRLKGASQPTSISHFITSSQHCVDILRFFIHILFVSKTLLTWSKSFTYLITTLLRSLNCFQWSSFCLLLYWCTERTILCVIRPSKCLYVL